VNRFLKPLKAFIDTLQEGALATRVEYHLEAGEADARWFSNQLRQRVPQALNLSEEFPVVFIRWNRLPTLAGDRMHPRYILTERGGLRFDYGLDEGGDGETTDVSILDWGVYERRWREFLPESQTYQFKDGWIVSGSRVRRVVPENGVFKPKTPDEFLKS
jgi:hypothetical protein